MQTADSLSKSMMESDAYLEMHLVEGAIVKRLNEGEITENYTTLETKQIHVIYLFILHFEANLFFFH
jgi:hypothetical protein